MSYQSDLFCVTADVVPEPPRDGIEATLVPLAMPCGYLNAANKPCARLAHRPVLIDGFALACRGIHMLHCEIECFRAEVRHTDARLVATR